MPDFKNLIDTDNISKKQIRYGNYWAWIYDNVYLAGL